MICLLLQSFLLNVMKPLVLQLMEDLKTYMVSHSDIIRSGFKAAGITNPLDNLTVDYMYLYIA